MIVEGVFSFKEVLLHKSGQILLSADQHVNNRAGSDIPGQMVCYFRFYFQVQKSIH